MHTPAALFFALIAASTTTGCMIDPEESKSATDADTTDSMDTNTEIDPTVDADGDGVTADADCDDANPWVNEGCGRACVGDVEITSNEELTQIAGCASIDGSVDVEGLTQTDMTGFNSLESITGSLWIMHSPGLESLEGLNNLQRIDEDLLLSYNDSLVSMDGLESLTTIGNTLSLSNSENLTDLMGLSNLTEIHGSMMINNLGVDSVDALDNLQTIGASIYVSECANLQSLSGLTTSLNSLGEDEIIGTYDEEGYQIASLFYVYMNDVLCQDLVDQTTTHFENIGWTGTANSWDNNGPCQ